MPGFRQVPFNDIEALKNAVNDKTCAVVLEPVQGEGGILPADLEYLKQVRALCDEKGILLLFDEVQCGMGRIGTRFAWQSFGVEPDAFSMAKAIANGLPMGGFITKRKYADTLTREPMRAPSAERRSSPPPRSRCRRRSTMKACLKTAGNRANTCGGSSGSSGRNIRSSRASAAWAS